VFTEPFSQQGMAAKTALWMPPKAQGGEASDLSMQGPLANLTAHLSNPFGNNITKNIGRCMIPSSVDVQGIRIPLTCLWPGQQIA
jgi:hypothetical protein